MPSQTLLRKPAGSLSVGDEFEHEGRTGTIIELRLVGPSHDRPGLMEILFVSMVVREIPHVLGVHRHHSFTLSRYSTVERLDDRVWKLML